MDKKIARAVTDVFDDFDEGQVMAIYLTGSQLNNLQTEESDVDLYVILKHTKRNMVLGTLRSGEKTGEKNYKYMDSVKFLQLLYKTNPNLLEIIYKKPLYVHHEYKNVAEFIYENKEEIVRMNVSRYFSSSYHMAKNNYKKLLNNTGKVAKGETGKEVLNFYKAYYQADAFYKNEDLTGFIIYEGKLRDAMMKIKKIGVLPEKNRINELSMMEACLNRMEKFKDEHSETKQNFEIFDKLINKILDI